MLSAYSIYARVLPTKESTICSPLTGYQPYLSPTHRKLDRSVGRWIHGEY